MPILFTQVSNLDYIPQLFAICGVLGVLNAKHPASISETGCFIEFCYILVCRA